MSLTKVSYSMINGAPINVFDYGADATGSTDSLAAIQAAITAAQNAGGGVVYLPKGTYKITDTLTISDYGVSIIGDGVFDTTITINSTTADAISISGAGYLLKGFVVTRSVVPVSGNGVSVAKNLYGTIEEVWSKNHTKGFYLGPTSRSNLFVCRAESNYSDGFYFYTTSDLVASQWQMRENLAQFNNGNGYQFFAASAVTGIDTTSPVMINNGSYSNNLNGFVFGGDTNTSWNDLVMMYCYSSFDGASGINFQNLGRNNQIQQYFGEGAGTSNTGRGQATSPTNVGTGLEIGGTCRGSNSSSLTFSGICQNNSYQGFTVYTNNLAKLIISNSLFQDNGKNTGSGNRQGVAITDLTSTATIIISDIVSGNTGSGTSQTYGYSADSSSTLNRTYITNSDLSNNSVANITPGISSVTQSTSKTTSVVLNALTGKITMNNAPLASGANAVFYQNNSTVAIDDVIIGNIVADSVASIATYSLSAHPQPGGNILWCLINISGGSLSEAPVINYSVIKRGVGA